MNDQLDVLPTLNVDDFQIWKPRYQYVWDMSSSNISELLDPLGIIDIYNLPFATPSLWYDLAIVETAVRLLEDELGYPRPSATLVVDILKCMNSLRARWPPPATWSPRPAFSTLFDAAIELLHDRYKQQDTPK